MKTNYSAYVGADIFDGDKMFDDHALLVRGDSIVGIVARTEIPAEANQITVNGGLLSPGFVDLQVNGGGGVMFNDAPTVDTLRIMAKAHAELGATSILPTLITDTPEQVHAAIAAVRAAIEQKVDGIIGLHLEGPHLSLARKGAHDPSLIRLMTPEDEDILLAAAKTLPVLKVTIAPESVTPAQMRRLSDAGILLSIGHSDAGYDECRTAAQNGVRCVTHLFNAMSQLGNREPGLVGAALDCPTLSAGLIADLIHVHPASIATAIRAKSGPGNLFLVSDAMATAGADIDHFFLNGRRIDRRNQRLTLQDGTLAGADLDLATAVANIAQFVEMSRALAMATSIPAALIGCSGVVGSLTRGSRAHFIKLKMGKVESVWQSGQRITLAS
jgi:N-acetylglucosamine-6-phosphate deacetylase